MEEKNNMPISFQMALAHNRASMKAFLNMPNDEQDKIIAQSKNVKNVREMNNFVNNIGKSN